MNEHTEPPDALETSAWADASLAAAMLAVDPVGLGGALIKGHPGPVRDQWLELLKQYLPAGAPFRKIPNHIKEDRLLGGLDLTATLHSGRPVGQQGLLAQAHDGVAVLAMAERVSNTVAALIGAAIDTGEVVTEREGITMRSQAKFGLIALDEGVDDDEEVPSCLTERLAIVLDLNPIGVQEVFGSAVEVGAADTSSIQLVSQARHLLPDVRTDMGTVRALCAAAWALGIRSARTPLLAGRVARVSAALDGRVLVNEEDAAAAARLVLAPRALIAFSAEQTPSDPEENTDVPPDLEPPSPDGRDADPEEQPDQQMDSPEHDSAESREDVERMAAQALEDLVLAAARAAIPPGLLAQLKAQGIKSQGGRGGGRAGAARRSVRRGRPVGSTKGEPGNGARLSVIDTLRAAAPWQRLRNTVPSMDGSEPVREQTPLAKARVSIRPDDIRIRRYQQKSETTTLFVVDASGSAALSRLAEAKGAVELLLADCYVRRDRVAVMGFRGKAAELLLPPTRSLVRAKRSLAGLPGGGGTPLASAIEQATLLADAVLRRGDTPLVVMLTDGKANISRNGIQGRAAGEADAQSAAQQLKTRRHASLLIDTSAKPSTQARQIAGDMGAIYLFLPHAGATAISNAVRATGFATRAGR